MELPLDLKEKQLDALQRLKTHRTISRNEIVDLTIAACDLGCQIKQLNLRINLAAAIDELDDGSDLIQALRDKLSHLFKE